MGDAFLPHTVRFANKIISWMEKRPALYHFFGRLALKYDNLMDYRKYGLMRDDLIPEEHDVVYEALKRLTDKEMFDRTFRLRRAVQLNLTKETLPRSEWIRQEDDVPYLWRHIEAISNELHEKKQWDNYVPSPGDLSKNFAKIVGEKSSSSTATAATKFN